MNTLIIINEPPYGSERSYNALRLAKALMSADSEVSLFLMADGSVVPGPARKCRKVFTVSNSC